MARRTSTLLSIAASFFVLGPSFCPEEFCEEVPEACVVNTSKDAPTLAAGEETTVDNLAEPQPDPDKT